MLTMLLYMELKRRIWGFRKLLTDWSVKDFCHVNVLNLMLLLHFQSRVCPKSNSLQIVGPCLLNKFTTLMPNETSADILKGSIVLLLFLSVAWLPHERLWDTAEETTPFAQYYLLNFILSLLTWASPGAS